MGVEADKSLCIALTWRGTVSSANLNKTNLFNQAKERLKDKTSLKISKQDDKRGNPIDMERDKMTA